MHFRVALASTLAVAAVMLEGCGSGGGAKTTTTTTTPPGPVITTTLTTTAPQYGAKIKAVTYNLFWWCVSGNPKDNPEIHNEHCHQKFGGGKGFEMLYAVIKAQLPFDVIGFSECIDAHKILVGTGLQDKFEAYLAPPQSPGTSDSGFMWNKDTFSKLEEPSADLMSTDQYGQRWLGYIRLKVKKTGQTLLFANTHGGLGHCDGKLGEDVYANFVNSIEKRRKAADSVIVTGDFNCRPNQQVMKLIAKKFSIVHDSTQLFDNIVRSNWVRLDDWRAQNPPNNPSDHSIVWAEMSLPIWPDGHAVPDPPSPGPDPSRMSKCAVIGCGKHDNSCWCTPSCKSHDSCCPDYDTKCGHVETNITENVVV